MIKRPSTTENWISTTVLMFLVALWCVIGGPARAQMTNQVWTFGPPKPANFKNIPADPQLLAHPPGKPPKLNADGNGYGPGPLDGSRGILLNNMNSPTFTIHNYQNTERKKRLDIDVVYKYAFKDSKKLDILSGVDVLDAAGDWGNPIVAGSKDIPNAQNWKNFHAQFFRYGNCPASETVKINRGGEFLYIDTVSIKTQCIDKDQNFLSTVLGDSNNDGLVNNQDIQGFVDILLADPPSPEQELLAEMNLDTNLDGQFNNQDIDPFVDLLLLADVDPAVISLHFIPEPSTGILTILGILVITNWFRSSRRRGRMD